MFDKQSIHIAMLLWAAIFSGIALVCMFLSKNFERQKRKYMLAIQGICVFLMLSDSLAWRFRGCHGKTGFIMVVISNFLVFILSQVILFVYNGYLRYCMFGGKGNEGRKRFISVYVITVVAAILIIISQFTDFFYYIDENNCYHRNKAYMFLVFMSMAGMFIEFTILIQYRKRINGKQFTALISYMVLPFIAGMIQIFYYGISLINISISISMMLMLIIAISDQNENVAINERKAAELKIELMLSQIAPHFIYNSLTTIAQMCEIDPAMAKETAIQFSDYLRGNLDSLGKNECILFEDELRHTKCYTAIEKKRFGDRVNVRYDICESDFLIPALTLQPIVENAIKYGLCMKAGGGTVNVHTERKSGNIYITVSDNGTGFDMDSIYKDGKKHVGIMNVRSRLKSMCGGRLEVESTIGRGTVVTIILPQ